MRRLAQESRGQSQQGRPPKPGKRSRGARFHQAPHQHEVLFGIHPVEEMLRAGRRRCATIWMAREPDQPRMAELRRLAAASQIPIQPVTMDQVAKLCNDGRHQGVAAEVSPFPVTGIDAVLSASPSAQSTEFILALDSISDPQNLGAILRTALCVGCAAVLLPRDRSVRPTPMVSKTSAGALEHTRLVQVTNLANTLDMFKKRGFWVAGTDVAAGEVLFNSDLTGPLVLVIGSENKGIRPLVRQRCDFLLTIPQVGSLGSLNAATAAAVVLYEAFRQRNRAAADPT